MFKEKRFDFGGGDGESFVLDHLFAAVEDVVKAIGIRAHDVAGAVPAIAKNGGGGLRLLPVSEHDLRAAHDEFAGFARGDIVPVQIEDAAFGEGQRLSDGGGAVHFRGSDVADVSDRRSFGHAVSLSDADAGEVGRRRASSGASGAAPLDPADFVVPGEVPASAAWQSALMAGGTMGIMVTPS